VNGKGRIGFNQPDHVPSNRDERREVNEAGLVAIAYL
jgi:hypothetical protein